MISFMSSIYWSFWAHLRLFGLFGMILFINLLWITNQLMIVTSINCSKLLMSINFLTIINLMSVKNQFNIIKLFPIISAHKILNVLLIISIIKFHKSVKAFAIRCLIHIYYLLRNMNFIETINILNITILIIITKLF